MTARPLVAIRVSYGLRMQGINKKRVLDEAVEYPAEHNVGHLYPAKPDLKAFYKELDPCNAFNPGVG